MPRRTIRPAADYFEAGREFSRRLSASVSTIWGIARRKTQQAIGVQLSAASSPLGWRRPFELEFLDAVANLIAVETEQGRGLRLVPAASFEGLHDQRSFELLEVYPGRWQ